MRRLVQAALILGALAATAAALAIVFRAPLLEAVLREALAARGLPAARLTVEQVDWRQLTIADLALGTQGELKVRSAAIGYDPRDLVAGRIETLALDGAALTIDLTGRGPPLGSLHALLSGDGGEDAGEDAGEAPAPHFPAVVLRDGRLTLLTPHGPVYGSMAAHLTPAAGGGIQGSLTFDLAGAGGRLRGHAEAARSPAGRTQGVLVVNDGSLTLPGPKLGGGVPSEIALSGLRGAARVTLAGADPESAEVTLGLEALELAGVTFDRAGAMLRLDAGRLDASLSAASADRGLSLALSAGLDGVPQAPLGVITLDADLAADSALWSLLPLPAPKRGTVNASLALAGPVPSGLTELSRRAAGYEIPGVPATMGLHGTFRFKEIDYPPHIKGLSADITLEAPAESESAADTATLAVSLQAANLEGTTASAADLAVRQTIGIHADDQKVSLRIRDRGFFSAQDLAIDVRVIGDGPSRIDLLPVGRPFAVVGAPFEAGRVQDIDLKLLPDPVRLRLARPEGDEIPLEAAAKILHVTGAYRAHDGFAGRIAIEDGSAALPEQEVAAEALRAALDIAPGGDLALAFDIGALRHTAEPPLVRPLNFEGQARLAGDAVAFTANLSGPDRLGRVTLSGRHRTESGQGRAHIRLDPLAFAPGAAQPGGLFPALESLTNVAGEAQGSANVSWSAEGIAGTAAFGLEGVSFDSPAARVEGLSLGLVLDRLQPPGSPPGQSLRVRRIDPGVPLEDLAVRYRIVPGDPPSDPPSLAVAEAGFSLAGGRFILADVVIDPAAEQLHLPIRVEGLDLAEVFGLLGVEGLSGDGRLSGTLPLRIVGGTPGIERAHLAAAGPGLLRVRSEQVRQTLSAAGESADLLLRALEDFHYEELTLSIDQSSAEEAVVGLSMLGNNPAVLEGYPFRFNINLETNPRKLLAALWQAYSISNRALRQIWMFER